MSVLIKGMEMPEYPTTIRIQIEADGSVYQNSDKTGNGWALQKNVAAIEVPPHGDLIDKIALLNHMTNVHKEWQEHPEQHKSIITIIDDELIVNLFPAIIEAEDNMEETEDE